MLAHFYPRIFINNRELLVPSQRELEAGNSKMALSDLLGTQMELSKLHRTSTVVQIKYFWYVLYVVMLAITRCGGTRSYYVIVLKAHFEGKKNKYLH